ncbi:SapC family protein [Colwelliaceae bacterium 6471]
MSAKASLLNYTSHGKVKVKETHNYQHVNNQHVIPLVVHEFSRAGSEMPVVFVKNTDTGEFQSVAILGLTIGENLFYGEEKWRSNYVPAYVTHHPFALMPAAHDETQLQIIIDESSDLVSEEEGQLLFDEQGNETEYMQKRKNALGLYYEHTHITKAFVNTLNELGLLMEQSLAMNVNGAQSQLNGVYLVDEKKLNALSDEDFLELRKRGFLAPIYAHLGSVHQLHRLAALKTQ